MTTDPFLDGGDSLPGIKLAEVGDKVTGQIITARQVEDRDIDGTVRTWPNGDTRSVWVFDLDTDGDGEADGSLWVRGNLFTVLRDALKAAQVPTVGAMISVTHHALGTPKVKGYHPPKLFTAKAKAGPPIKLKADAFTGDDSEDPF